MAMFDDPGRALRELDRELRAAEPPREDVSEEGADFSRMLYADETLEDRQVYYEEDFRRDRKKRPPGKKKSGCAPILLVLVMAALIWGWLLWRK